MEEGRKNCAVHLTVIMYKVIHTKLTDKVKEHLPLGSRESHRFKTKNKGYPREYVKCNTLGTEHIQNNSIK